MRDIPDALDPPSDFGNIAPYRNNAHTRDGGVRPVAFQRIQPSVEEVSQFADARIQPNQV
jgi:hypothetical protein